MDDIYDEMLERIEDLENMVATLAACMMRLIPLTLHGETEPYAYGEITTELMILLDCFEDGEEGEEYDKPEVQCDD